jgi:hypothetical protein
MSIMGSCHCGKTAFHMDVEMPAQLTRCTCSFCAKRGALLAYCEPAQFRVTVLPADAAIYRWQTREVAHHFCAHCGCATFSDSPAFEPVGKWDGRTRRIGVNARLFDDVDAALAVITVIDGKHLW